MDESFLEKVWSLTRGDRPCVILFAEKQSDNLTTQEAVLREVVKDDSNLDVLLTKFSVEQNAVYARVEIAKTDFNWLYKFGLRYLPQVRLIRRGKTLLKSSVTKDLNGHFVFGHVGSVSGLTVSGNSSYTSSLLSAIAQRIKV